MRINLKQMIETGCASRAELHARLNFWAARYGFKRASDDGDSFVYTRGSQWHALYTFDLRKVPTTVTVAMLPGDEGLCVCNFTCASWLQVTSAGVAERLSEQMDLLEACLKGALSAQSADARAPIVESRSADTGIQKLQDG